MDLDTRPYSAPAVMHQTPSTVSASSTPESIGRFVEYVENQRGVHCGASGNVRVPHSKTAARFAAADQRPLTGASWNALCALTKPHHPKLVDNQNCLDSSEVEATDDAACVLSESEIKREAARSYRQPLQDFNPADPHAVAAPASSSNNAMGSFFHRLATTHSSRLSSLSAKLADSRRPNVAATLPSTLVVQEEELLQRRSRAAVQLQRAVRRFIASSRGARLIGLLHLVVVEIAAPRFPLLLERDARVTPLVYAMELALEYEYALYVENTARRLVVEARTRETSPDEVREACCLLWTRKAVLTDAEVSNLHETVQTRLSQGDFIATAKEVAAGLCAEFLGAEGIAVLAETFQERTRGIEAGNMKPTQSHASRRPQLTEDSFLMSVARAVCADVRCAPTPTWSQYKSSHAEPPYRLDEPTWESVPSCAQLRKEMRSNDIPIEMSSGSLVHLSDRDAHLLVASTPPDWFVGGSEGPAEATLRVMPPPPTGACLDQRPAEWSTVSESDLEKIWQRTGDPEQGRLQRAARRMAQRRLLGADYDEDTRDFDETVEAEEVKLEQRHNFEILGPDASAFDSSALATLREKTARDAWQRSQELVTNALAAPPIGNSTHFDPVSWGLDASPAAFHTAARVMTLSIAQPRSSGGDDLAALRTVVIQLGCRNTTLGPADQAGDTSEASRLCVVCEIDAVDVRKCNCGNWVHRECSFGYDEDADQATSASKSASLKCCSLCR